MKRKWLIVGPLLLVEILVCGAIVLALWSGGNLISRMGSFHLGITAERTQEWTFPVQGAASLDVTTVSGDVEVTGTNADEVKVIAHLRLWGWNEEHALSQLRVETAQDGNQVTVRVVRPPLTLFGGGEVDFEIQVPRETTVTLSSTSGSLAVNGITGTVHLESTSGAVTASDVHGSLTAESVSGAVRATGGVVTGTLSLKSISGDVAAIGVIAPAYRLESTSGDVLLNWCSGSVTLETVSGQVDVRQCTASYLWARSSSGDVVYSGDLSAGGDYNVETISGDVLILLPADASFDVTAETVSGDIETDFPVTTTAFDDRSLVGRVGDGGSRLSIGTTSGDILLKTGGEGE